MIMGAWHIGRKRLPYDAEVEYLEWNGNDGQQCFVTGVVVDDNSYVIECDGRITIAGPVWNHLFHTYKNESTESTRVIVFETDLPKIYTGYRRQSGSQTLIAPAGFTFANRNVFRLEYRKLTVTPFDGSPMVFTLPPPSAPGDAGFLRADNYGEKWYYGLKVWHGGEPVLDWVPVRKGAVGYFFDRVTGELVEVYQNGLTVGPDNS
ncbi:MAG: hypothetical protein J6V72_21840 [Kiritimatiellae bacterium]|nr:hypothetical protein [Kiritimatiellia bacterium]